MKNLLLGALLALSVSTHANNQQIFVQKGCPKGRVLLRKGQALRLQLKDNSSKRQFWTSYDKFERRQFKKDKDRWSEFLIDADSISNKPRFYPFSQFYFLMFKVPGSAELVNVCKLSVRYY
jgi:hypothetical protein